MSSKTLAPPYARRIALVKERLRRFSGTAALVAGSAPDTPRRGDDHHIPRMQSDVYYLTGLRWVDSLLVLSTLGEAPTIYVPRTWRADLRWRGRREDLRAAAARIGAEIVLSDDIRSAVMKRLDGIQHLVYQNEPGSLGYEIAQSLMAIPAKEHRSTPRSFHQIGAVLDGLRSCKDRSEIELVRRAAGATFEGIRSALPLFRPGVTEDMIAERIDYTTRLNGGIPRSTSIAAGRSAVTPHYQNGTRRLKQGEMVLIDCACEFEMYCSDLTRMFPIGAVFSETQRILYQGVLEAQQAAIDQSKAGVTLQSVYRAAAFRLIETLIELRVLRGKARKLFECGAHRQYSPHGYAHTLGIDFYDVDYYHLALGAPLRPGMALTIEPGLYFPKPVGLIRVPCGLRLEDDVVVGKNQARIITDFLPRQIDDVEELMAGSGGS